MNPVLSRCAVALGWALFVALLTGGRAVAQEPYTCIDELSSEELDARIRWMDSEWQRGKTHARLWWYGQIALWAGVVGFEVLSLLRAENESQRWHSSVGLVGSGLTLAQLLIIPHPPAYVPQRFRGMPERTLDEQRAKLRYGLDRLEVSAQRQALIRGVFGQGVVVAWTGGWAAYLGVRFRDVGSTLFNSVGGLILSEFRILTAPMGAYYSWEKARSMMCGHRYMHRERPAPEVSFGPLSVAVVF